MRNYKIINALFAILFLLGLTACSDRDIIKVDNSTAPIAMNLSSENIFLDKNFPDNPALNITWDKATYTVPTEINYKIEVSPTSSFTKIFTLGTVSESVRTATYTASQLNAAATAIGLVANTPGTMYIRVASYLGSGFLSATSASTKVTVTPYELEYPTFYLVGAASYVGWDSGKAQILYKNKNMSYIYTYLEGNQPFRFLGQQAWNPLNYSIDQDGTRTNYRYFKQVSSNLIQDGDENMKFTGATGIYKISINADATIQSLDVSAASITGFDFPVIYLVGSINSWDAANAIAMTKVSTGVFEYTTTIPDNAEFKFIGQKSWGDLEWGNILKDNAGNSGFLGPKGDNGNIKYSGGGTSHKITVNLKAGIYTIE